MCHICSAWFDEVHLSHYMFSIKSRGSAVPFTFTKIHRRICANEVSSVVGVAYLIACVSGIEEFVKPHH